MLTVEANQSHFLSTTPLVFSYGREEVYHFKEKRVTVPEFGRRAHRGNGHSAKSGTGLMSPKKQAAGSARERRRPDNLIQNSPMHRWR